MTNSAYFSLRLFLATPLFIVVGLASQTSQAQAQPRAEASKLVFAGAYELVGGNNETVCARNLKTKEVECRPAIPSSMVTVGELKAVFHTAFATCGVEAEGRFTCWNYGSDFKSTVLPKLQGGKPDDYSAASAMLCRRMDASTQVCYAPRFESATTDPSGVSVFKFSEPLRSFAMGDGRVCGLEAAGPSSSRLRCFYSRLVSSGEYFNLPSDTLPGATRLWVGESSVCSDSSTGLRCFDKTGEMTLKSSPEARADIGSASHGGNHFCWLNSAGTTVNCEALNSGLWVTPAYTVPNSLASGLPFRAIGIAAGDDYTCLLSESGDPRCFGATGSPVVTRSSMIPKGLKSLSPARNSVCGLTEDGLSRCWGAADATRAVLRTTDTPVSARLSVWGACAWNSSGVTCTSQNIAKVPDLGEILGLSISVESSSAACALHKTPMGAAEVRCWGSQNMINSVPTNLTEPQAVALNDRQACAASRFGIQCWGRKPWTETPSSVSNLRRLAMGPDYGCALDDFGLTCFGAVPPALQQFVEFERPGAVRDFAISPRGSFCAIREDERVECLPISSGGSSVNEQKPAVSVSGLRQPREIQIMDSFGSAYGCASDQDGVRCWGTLPSGAR
jgi:hypothetical protein